MKAELLTNTAQKYKINLDPRTKIVILIAICILIVGGRSDGIMIVIKPVLAMIPFFLLFSMGKWKRGVILVILYLSFFVGETMIVSMISGVGGFLLLFLFGVVGRLLPCLVMGYYTVNTTTVSEFIAAMEKIHMTEKITIPISVMLRFFPTVMEEYHSIGDAMRMRGIRFGGEKLSKIIEYRFIPMMICSVKIGEELSAAALTRGLGAPIRRTNICKIGFHALDVFLMTVCISMLILNILRAAGVL